MKPRQALEAEGAAGRKPRVHSDTPEQDGGNHASPSPGTAPSFPPALGTGPGLSLFICNTVLRRQALGEGL